MHMYETAFLLPGWPRDHAEPRLLCFELLGQCVRFVCEEEALRQRLGALFWAQPRASAPTALDLTYVIVRDSAGYRLRRPGLALPPTRSLDELLQRLTRDLLATLQARRPDLLHLRAAAFAYRGQAWLVAGGTPAWRAALCAELPRSGFHYLGGELSAVDLEALQVLPLPHAPNWPAPAPDAGAGGAAWSRHPLTSSLERPLPMLERPCALQGLLFVQGPGGARPPSPRALHPAEAAARLYAATLNATAHARHGIDAVVGVAKSVDCWHLPATAPQALGRALLGLAARH